MLAAIRPDDWNLPLLVHVSGAMLLVGGLAAAAAFQLYGWRRQRAEDAAGFARLAFRSLLFAALPAWFVMRLGAEWIYRRQGWQDVGAAEPTWLGIGWITADLGGFLLLLSIVLTGIGARRLRLRRGERSTLVRVAAVLTLLALIAYVVATWAMAGKPA
ncbi:MAG TPA: hypothetical protein VK915_00050 [Gaiellaceae bacterium]|nr:hypothetical protein [Gaiellaceae bacterium]